jgi:hypothetical protein
MATYQDLPYEILHQVSLAVGDNDANHSITEESSTLEIFSTVDRATREATIPVLFRRILWSLDLSHSSESLIKELRIITQNNHILISVRQVP